MTFKALRRGFARSRAAERGVRRDAAALVAAVAGAETVARWRRGHDGGPAMVTVMVENDATARQTVATLHDGWLRLREHGPEVDFVAIADLHGAKRLPAVALVMGATVALDPDAGSWRTWR